MSKRTSPRVIAGDFKGLNLKSVPGTITRPITDRVKENLFNIISSDIIGTNFLDLFGGTGSVGIEAISRGAKYVHLIEKNTLPFKILSDNLKIVPDKNRYGIEKKDAFTFIRSHSVRKYDYVFIAPPQYKGLWERTITLLISNLEILNPQAWIIVQIDPVEYQKIQCPHLIEFDSRKYGSTMLIFYLYEDSAMRSSPVSE